MMVEVMAGQAVTPFGRHRCNAASRFHYNTMKPADAVKSARRSVQTTVLQADLSRGCGAFHKRANPLFMHLSGTSSPLTRVPRPSGAAEPTPAPTKTGAPLRTRPLILLQGPKPAVLAAELNRQYRSARSYAAGSPRRLHNPDPCRCPSACSPRSAGCGRRCAHNG